MLIDLCNIQGLRSNFSEVRAHIDLFEPDLFLLTETQIVRSAPDLTAPKGYTLVDSFAKKHGVCAYIHPKISYGRAIKYEINNKHFNSLVLRFSTGGKYVFIFTIYRSPNTPTNIDSFDELSDSVCAIFNHYPNAQLIVLGDFNIHNHTWLTHSSHTDVPGRRAEVFAATFGLQQLVDEPTRIPNNNQCANTLDLVLSSFSDADCVSVLPPIGTSDHCLISLNVNLSPIQLSPPPPRAVYQYSKANWNKLENFFTKYDWSQVTDCHNIDDAVENFTAAIHLGMKLFIPILRERKSREKIFSAKVRVALMNKKMAYRQFNAVRSTVPQNPDLLKQARQDLRTITNSCKSTIKTEDFLFFKKKTDKVLENPNNLRCFFHTVRALGGNFGTRPLPPLVDKGIVIPDTKGKCNVLGAKFATTSTTTASNPTFKLLPQVPSRMNPLIIRKKIIKKYLSELNVNKANGPDGIPALVLKKFSNIFAPIVTKIFVLAVRSGRYPTPWKTANIQPVPKKGDGSDPSNYRPIAIISVLSKIFERYITWNILDYAEKHKLLNENQYGFLKSRSTCDALNLMVHEWNETVEEKNEAYAISLDLAKAFDTVNHEILISKLISYGFDPSLVTLLTDFLSKRKISVTLEGHQSDIYEINAGVPQGSALAPTLFLFYINDLLSVTNNKIVSFADDTTLYGKLPLTTSDNTNSHNSRHKMLASSLTSDLTSIESWSTENLMNFNHSKTHLCAISKKPSTSPEQVLMNNQPLSNCESFRLLGVTINKKLLWNEHVENIAKSAAQKLGFLARSRKFFNSEQCLRIYKSMIRPCLEYCSPVWGGASETVLSWLDLIQKRAIKIINDPIVTNSLHSLQHRRDVADLSLFYRYYFGSCSFELKSNLPPLHMRIRESRGSSQAHPYILEERTCRTTHFQNDFFTRTVHHWNKLPNTLLPSTSLGTFKSNLNKFLLANPLPRLSSHIR